MIGKQTFKNSGVSPVVGVILMVAVTVILAAVIGTFVLDLGGSVSQSAQAGVSFDEDIGGSTVDVQLTTIQAADSIWVTTDGTSASYTGPYDAAADMGDQVGPDPSSGSQYSQYLLGRSGDGSGGPGSIVSVDYSGETTISVIGEVDGETTVIQTYTTGN